MHYDPELPVKLACDASPYGCGAVLSHTLKDGSERPVAFASRTLNDAEKNYSQIDKEALALVWGVKTLHAYLYGKRFTGYGSPAVAFHCQSKERHSGNASSQVTAIRLVPSSHMNASSQVTTICLVPPSHMNASSQVTTICLVPPSHMYDSSQVTAIRLVPPSHMNASSQVTAICLVPPSHMYDSSQVTAICLVPPSHMNDSSQVTAIRLVPSSHMNASSQVTTICLVPPSHMNASSQVTTICLVPPSHMYDSSQVTAICLVPPSHMYDSSQVTAICLVPPSHMYVTEFKPSSLHTNADGLSRLPCTRERQRSVDAVDIFHTAQLEALPVTSTVIRKQETRKDVTLSKVFTYSMSGWPATGREELTPYFQRRNEITTYQGCLMWGMRVMIPQKCQHQVLQQLQEDTEL
ncbi:uncharacterized protein LOC120037720 [Salvelinus namaycush]|uniref:Uncharacterized protein LOC120037720 n=1 Tax=Salvelinus namaycush TaxID=8040 RepID=A0A8U0U415_SALNM|nr:uncharacterized protein LOC120037720 [Salvelinus namaycush]